MLALAVGRLFLAKFWSVLDVHVLLGCAISRTVGITHPSLRSPLVVDLELVKLGLSELIFVNFLGRVLFLFFFLLGVWNLSKVPIHLA